MQGHRWRVRVVWATLASIVLLYSVLSAVAYNREVHFSVTMWLAELAGFPSDEAFEIAKYDQATDDDPTTQPLPGRPWKDPLGTERRELYHFVLSARRFEELRSLAFQCRVGPRREAYKRIGQYLHAIEDSYSHRTYGPAVGQGLDGSGPDFPWHVPASYRSMVGHKFRVLVQVRQSCSRQPDGVAVDLAAVDRELEQWVIAEQTAGTRGDEDSPARWKALMEPLFGKRRDVYTDTAVREYTKWAEEQQRQGWK